MRTRLPAVVAALAMALTMVLAILPGTVSMALAQPGQIVGPPVFATPTVLGDGIAPGVITGSEGFGTATVTVPTGARVTYIARTDSRLKGKKIQIWERAGTGAWKLFTTRVIAADGTVHLYATVTGPVSFWAKFAGDSKNPPALSHGRNAAASTNGLTIIRAGCDDFSPPSSASRVVLSRTVGLKVGSSVSIILCSDAATGFAWSPAAIDPSHLKLVRHTTTPPAAAVPGAAGLETWTYRLLESGSGRATLTYSQPWKGGQKAVWTVSLLVQGQG
jgi:predicted secreted protein